MFRLSASIFISLFGVAQSARILPSKSRLQDSSGPPLQIFNCSDDPDISKFQLWIPHADNTITLNYTGLCMDVQSYSIDDEATIWTYTCHQNDPDPSHHNQFWSINANGTITEIMSGKCVDVSDYGVEPGQQVWLYHCTGADNQQWQLQEVQTGIYRIVGKQSGLCLDAGTLLQPCTMSQFASMPFCNTSLPVTDRVQNLVSNINSEEQAGLFDTTSTGIGTLLISPYEWWNEALHGIAFSPGVSFGSELNGATSFPHICTSSQSWNKTLFYAIGTVVGTEGRAFNNVRQAGLTFWAPNINIFRDPRWGRGQETPGEDPFLTSQYAIGYVSGMQWGDDPRYIKSSSCAKHYAAYSLENWSPEPGVVPPTDRHHFNAVVTAQDETDTYLVAFQAAVEIARVSGIMCSYNEVNGIPSCANSFLLNEIARGEWNFYGYITSDCGAITDIEDTHKYTNNSDDTVRVTFEGGTDIGCDGFIPPALPQALQDGAVTEAQVQNALTNLFTVKFRLGEFDPFDTQPYRQIPPSAVCTAASQQLALEAAMEGMVLLKNNGTNALPLSSSEVKTLAVVGPNADATTTMQGNYYGAPCSDILSPQVALGSFATVTYVEGCTIAGNATTGFAAAIAAAKAADATIVVQNFINQVCAAAKGTCAVVVMAGGSVDLTALKGNPQVDAVLWTGYPGEAGGIAIANTIFGVNVPAGRLTQTIYPASYINQISMFEMNMRPGPSNFPPGTSPGRTYRFYTGAPVYEFGYGLSYTTFTYGISGPAVVDSAPIRKYLVSYPRHNGLYASLISEKVATYVVNVTNTGSITADDVVIGFLVPPGAGQNGVPLQYVFGFERVTVPAGETVQVWLGVTARDLTHVTADGLRVPLLGDYHVRVGVESHVHAFAPMSVKMMQ